MSTQFITTRNEKHTLDWPDSRHYITTTVLGDKADRVRARAAEEVRAMRALAEATDIPAVFMQDYANIVHSRPRRTGKNALLDDIRAALATVEAAKQTVLCHPSLRAKVEEQIEAEGLQHRVRVIQTPYIEQARMYVLSQRAVDFTKGCDCLIHPDRAMFEDGDPYGCYCECAETDEPTCDHKRE